MGGFGKDFAEEVEGFGVEVLEHAELGDGTEGFDGLEGGGFGVEEENAREEDGGERKELDGGFEEDGEGAFGADQEVDPVHAGAEGVAGLVLGGGGEGKGGDGEIDGFAAVEFADGAVHEGGAEGEDVTAGGAEAEGAGAGGVGGEGAAEGGAVVGGIRGVELLGGLGGDLEIGEEEAGTDAGGGGSDVAAVEFGEAEGGAGEGNSPASDAREGTDYGEGLLVRFEEGDEFAFRGGGEELGGFSFEAGGVFEQHQISRITGMIRGRRWVSLAR